ncbi:hypothetical protein PSACC_01106 [Paramicrosporidium saccamoebae]|uniref:Uncharacterized protein n=1 Tax=Paramicrosporidium saccamoebae TaxID=1246581 RepID=A0A2H9TN42_9FUNG|nr:hypothetical protein PSACC_01106 [Paramicrosporidium saccamoebae]
MGSDSRRDYRRGYRDHGRSSRSRSPDRQTDNRNDKRVEIAIHPLLMGATPEVKTASLVPKAALSTVAANIRAGSKDSVLLQRPKVDRVDALLAVRPPSLARGNPYFDRILPATGRSHRPKKLEFKEKGAFVAEAEQIRRDEEWERLRREVGESLGQVGLDTEIIADLLVEEQVPTVEWWDEPFLDERGLPDFGRVNNLIQRPALLPPPIDTIVPPKPLMLTTEEQKKLRRQRRLAEHKDKQEQIKLGLLPPEPPKVRIANIARILGTQSVQEPSRVEAEIRAQAQKRQQEHLDANLVRHEKAKEETAKRTSDRRNELMTNVPVAVFRIDNLTLPQWRFKVVKNAEQHELTGCVIYYEHFSFVVVEGKAAAVRRFKHLLLDRIKWTEAPPDTMADVSQNRCVLVWEGVVGRRSFYRFDNWTFSSEIDARAYLGKFGVEHYWKIAKDS